MRKIRVYRWSKHRKSLRLLGEKVYIEDEVADEMLTEQKIILEILKSAKSPNRGEIVVMRGHMVEIFKNGICVRNMFRDTDRDDNEPELYWIPHLIALSKEAKDFMESQEEEI